MNYDVYEVEVNTGIKGFRLLQHIKATDQASAEAQVAAIQKATVIASTLWRPCTIAEVNVAIAEGLVAVGTTPTSVDVTPAPVDLGGMTILPGDQNAMNIQPGDPNAMNIQPGDPNAMKIAPGDPNAMKGLIP